ncbi:MAG: hypothetical protein QXU88_02370 [Candidatus Woesearchaeota archaeon]
MSEFEDEIVIEGEEIEELERHTCDIYSEEGLDHAMEEDAISSKEEAFMIGWLAA